MNKVETPEAVEIPEVRETFSQLPVIAARLGVKPSTGSGDVTFIMKDGVRYDVFELINAFLDKMDAQGGREN